MSETNKNRLEAIQNTALRVILKKPREYGNDNLLKLAGMSTVESRCDALNRRFLEKAEVTGNPIITELIDDYFDLKESQIAKNKPLANTLFCNDLYINEQWELMQNQC